MRYPRSLMLPFSILMLLLIATPSINSAHSTSQQRPTISSYGTMRVMFEIELKGTDDTRYLYNETAIGVLGTVQRTPRYGVTGEALVHGMWMNSHFFDTTLSDRFVIRCTEEEAISMSIYAWVEWIAPTLEGTTCDGASTHNGEFGIFFEYGAESGILQPPWDNIGPTGSGDKYGSYTIVDDAHARTGNYSMKLYQIPPPKSDAQRRISNRYYGTGRKEFYISWWAYFDDRWLTQDPEGWGTTLGGWQIFFGPPEASAGGKWRWWTGGRFHISQTSRSLSFGYGWGKHADANDFSADTEAIEQIWDSGCIIDDFLNRWVHFQVYVKMAIDNTGVVKAWFNNALVAEKTNIKTDPEGYSEFVQNNCIWAVTAHPWIVVEIYQGSDSFESWIWVDDVVAASQKVPESYRVVDK